MYLHIPCCAYMEDAVKFSLGSCICRSNSFSYMHEGPSESPAADAGFEGFSQTIKIAANTPSGISCLLLHKQLDFLAGLVLDGGERPSDQSGTSVPSVSHSDVTHPSVARTSTRSCFHWIVSA
jgi:hypothetical protein